MLSILFCDCLGTHYIEEEKLQLLQETRQRLLKNKMYHKMLTDCCLNGINHDGQPYEVEINKKRAARCIACYEELHKEKYIRRNKVHLSDVKKLLASMTPSKPLTEPVLVQDDMCSSSSDSLETNVVTDSRKRARDSWSSSSSSTGNLVMASGKKGINLYKASKSMENSKNITSYFGQNNHQLSISTCLLLQHMFMFYV